MGEIPGFVTNDTVALGRTGNFRRTGNYSTMDCEMKADSPKELLQNRAPTTGIQDIADALIAAGYYPLDAQAKALGLRGSTAWTHSQGQT